VHSPNIYIFCRKLKKTKINRVNAQIIYVCPTYNALGLHDYTIAALRSFFRTTPGGVAIVVDDASPGWSAGYVDKLKRIADVAGGELHTHSFAAPLGLTRSWNHGLSMACDLGGGYVIAGNNDVIFTPGWSRGMIAALSAGYTMAAPLSNAPGITAAGLQEVSRHVPGYRVTDDPKYLATVADILRQNRRGKTVESRVNGFFQMCSMDGWQSNRYSEQHFFRPVNRRDVRGRKNPTPHMTLNEDEWQDRAEGKNLKIGIALDSFIFHYRAVSRGSRYTRGQAYRRKR